MSTPADAPILVVACDGSADADVAVEWAAKAALSAGGRVHLLEALGLPPIPLQPWMTPPAELLADSERLARERLEAQAAKLSRRGLESQLHVRRWLPTESIVELAAELDADLIVLGRHGRSAKRLLIGSVGGGVSRLAGCPVVVVRGERLQAPPRSILVALDGSASSRVAARAAARLFPRARVLAVHVHPGDDGLTADDLANEVTAIAFASADVQTRIVEGDPAATILELARSVTADLVTAGRRGQGPLRELIFGSVAEKLLQLAPCPILLAH